MEKEVLKILEFYFKLYYNYKTLKKSIDASKRVCYIRLAMEEVFFLCLKTCEPVLVQV